MIELLFDYRESMAAPLPIAVGVQFNDRGPWPGVLLEWKRIADKRGLPQWHGLVLFALPSLASPAATFAARLEWIHSSEIVALPDRLIHQGNR